MAFGFRPANAIGGTYQGETRRFAVASTNTAALFKGDAVTFTGTGIGKYASVKVATADSTAIVGVIANVVPNFAQGDLNKKHIPATNGVTRFVDVIVDTDVIFETQLDTTATAADIGETYNINAGSGVTTTGVSGQNLNGITGGTGAGQFRFLGYRDGPNDGDEGDAGATSVVLCKINNSFFSTGATSA